MKRALPAILLLSLAGLLGRACFPPFLWAATSDERLAAIEERLSRLEKSLEHLMEKIEASSSNRAEAREDLAALTKETQKIHRDQSSLNQSEQIQPPGPEVVSAASVIPTEKEAEEGGSREILNVPFAGYMETHLNHDGLNPTTFDFHRFVLLFGHGFGDRIRFWSELELEHAFVEGREASGEIALEQAYLDFLIHPKFNFRAGMILSPMGIINERHEPPSFNGVERSFVDTFIIPTTWFGSGGGFVGDLGKGFAYKAYLMTSLDASRFSAEQGFREGLQNGFLENARHMAPVGRLEYRGIAGMNLGTSFWTGRTGFNLRGIEGQARIVEFDGRYRRSLFEWRGQFASTHLNDAAEINRSVQRQTGINPNIAKSMRGFYLESGAHLFPREFKHDLVAFYRYENFDTQYRMPNGFLPLKQFDRSAHVVGITYYPYPDIALKFDYNFMRSASEVIQIPNRWNVGIGWWF